MAAQDPQELRTTDVTSEVAANEVLSPATPGAETLGTPDAQSGTSAGSTRTETEGEVLPPDYEVSASEGDVLAPATPGAEILGADDSETEGSQAN